MRLSGVVTDSEPLTDGEEEKEGLLWVMYAKGLLVSVRNKCTVHLYSLVAMCVAIYMSL